MGMDPKSGWLWALLSLCKNPPGGGARAGRGEDKFSPGSLLTGPLCEDGDNAAEV